MFFNKRFQSAHQLVNFHPRLLAHFGDGSLAQHDFANGRVEHLELFVHFCHFRLQLRILGDEVG